MSKQILTIRLAFDASSDVDIKVPEMDYESTRPMSALTQEVTSLIKEYVDLRMFPDLALGDDIWVFMQTGWRILKFVKFDRSGNAVCLSPCLSQVNSFKRWSAADPREQENT